MRAPALIVACIAAMPGLASAHSRLVEPPSRSEDDFLMDGPCGGAPPTGTPTTYEAGQVIAMEWVLSQNHFNVFQVAFSPHDDLGFDDNVIGTLPDETDVFEYVQDVPLPMCTCDGCTLQLTQFTATGKLAYYSCADIALVAPPGENVPPCPRVEAPPETETETDGGSTTASDPGDDTTSGSTSVSDTDGSPPPGSASANESGADGGEASGGGCRVVGVDRRLDASWMALGLLALAGIRRRRPR